MINLITETKKTPLLVFLFIGLVSIYYAEVFSGSSPIWFIQIWGLFVTFELYLAHLLFYSNIAIKTNRLSLVHLYLLGCLVGLYEGPITKVLWHGYPNLSGQTAQNFFLGFAIIEFIMLVFFWHPVFSFMIPIIVYELLSISYLHSIGSHSLIEQTFFFTKPRLAKYFFVVIALIGSIFLVVNSQFSITTILLSGIGNFVLLTLISNSLIKSNKFQGLSNTQLSSRWFKIVFSYLVILYIFMFFAINPDFIPGPLTLGITFLVFIFILFLFFKVPPTTTPKAFTNPPFNFLSAIKNSWLLWLVLIFALSICYLTFPPITGIIGILLIITYLLLIAFGLLVFLTTVLKILSGKINNKNNLIS